MLIERIPSWSSIFIYVVFVALVGVAVIIGFYGPQVWKLDSVSSWSCVDDEDVFNPEYCFGSDLGRGESWIGTITDLNKLNQELILLVEIENKMEYDDIGITKDVDFIISMEARETDDSTWETILDNEIHKRTVECEIGESYCNEITLIFQPFLSYNDYKFNVTLQNIGAYNFVGDTQFTFKYVNEYYSIFELLFRFFFLVVAFFSLMILTIGLRKFLWVEWKSEQKWTAILLFGAMAYDNPFFPMEILVRGWFFTFLDQVLTVSFISLLLFYFMALMDSIRLHAENVVHVKRYHIFKVLLILSIWAACITLWGFIEVNDIRDPEYYTASDIPYFDVFYYTIIVLISIYLCYLAYIGIRCFVALRAGGLMKDRIRFFVIFTFLVISMAIIGVIFNLYGPTDRHASIFLVYIAIFNLYTAILAVFYIPFGSEGVILTDSDEFSEYPTDIPMDEIKDEDDQGEILEHVIPLEKDD